MIRPNYKDFRRSKFVVTSGQCLEHSAKGSTWEEHKYIKRIDGTYYYPDSYEGGRHLPDGEKRKASSDEKDKDKLSSEEASKLNQKVYEDLISGHLYLDDDVKDFKKFKEMLEESYGIDASKYKDSDLKNIQKGLNNGVDPDDEKAPNLSDNDVENLAKEVIRGKFGVGQQRKDLLGENYGKVQKRVNELMKGSTGKKKVSSASKSSIKTAEEAAKKASSSDNTKKKEKSTMTKNTKKEKSKTVSGVDMDKVLGIYKKKNR